MKILGYYNEFGYRVVDIDQPDEDIYTAGNSRWDSTSRVNPGTDDAAGYNSDAIPLEHIKGFCIQTCKEFALETAGTFIGVEYEETD